MSGPQDAIARIQAIARTLPGMKEAPDYPPETINQFPFSLAYLRTSETIFEAGWRKDKLTIFWEIYLARQILPNTINQAMPYYGLALAALQDDPTLNGTVSTIIATDAAPLTSTFGWLEYGSIDNKLLGWRFAVTVKQET
jgi:hypothetical protein